MSKRPKTALAVLLRWQLAHSEKLKVMDHEAWVDLQRRIEAYAQDKVKTASMS